MQKIDIEKYIPMYEKREIKVREIAIKEDSNPTIIYKIINEYYEKQGREKPVFRKSIDIETYISMFEERKISLEEIGRKEEVCAATVSKKIDEYYENTDKEKPKFRGRRKLVTNIEKYIKLYEEKKITIREIAKKESVNESTIRERIKEYYEKEDKLCVKKEEKKIDIKQYINDLEEGKITVKEISNKEETSVDRIRNKIKAYYNKKGKKPPKVGVPIEVLKYFLTKGMTREEIRKDASKRNIIIPDEYFKKAEEKIISKEEEER